MMLPVSHIFTAPSKPREAFENYGISEESVYSAQSDADKAWGFATTQYNGKTLEVAFPEDE